MKVLSVDVHIAIIGLFFPPLSPSPFREERKGRRREKNTNATVHVETRLQDAVCENNVISSSFSCYGKRKERPVRCPIFFIQMYKNFGSGD